MPIYEYRCSECGHQQEHLQKVSDPLLTTCPQCGRESYRKQLTAAGFQLKGSGWYATDFKGGGQKQAAKAESKSESKSDAKPDAKVESKSESKPESKSESKSDAKTGKPATKATSPASGSS